jgi:multisubunit Na+/H+ antiporter MnhF subunit
MIDWATYLAFSMLMGAIGLGMWRMARGPTVIDRILSFDLITTSVVGMIVLLSIRWRTSVYLEVILIFSLLGFFGTVAFVFYLSRTRSLHEAPMEDGSGDGVRPDTSADDGEGREPGRVLSRQDSGTGAGAGMDPKRASANPGRAL